MSLGTYITNTITSIERRAKQAHTRQRQRYQAHKAFHDDYLNNSPKPSNTLTGLQPLIFTTTGHGNHLPSTRIDDIILGIDYHPESEPVDAQPPRDIATYQRIHNILRHVNKAEHYAEQLVNDDIGNLGAHRSNNADLRKELVQRHYNTDINREPWTPSEENQGGKR
jgi:hypothetical protein